MDYVRKGKVDWTGDNPPIYLKTDENGDWSTLSLFFRVNASDYGRGHMILVLQSPYSAQKGDNNWLCFTDNEPLAKYLVNDFVRKFGLFRPAGKAIDGMHWVTDANFSVEHDYPRHVTEIATAGDHSVAMRWDDLQEMFAVAQPPEDSQTGKHEMFSVFQPAGSAAVMVNGAALPGHTIERDFFDRRTQSAALAHSESWIQT